MKEPALVIIKPDGISKKLVGSVLRKFYQTDLSIIAMRVAKATREQAETHYAHIKGTPFFEGVINYLLGNFHKEKNIMVIVYYGNNAIKKCRKIAGATNPEEADPGSIRGSFGRITTKGLYENVVHVSSTKKEAEREIKLWFGPGDLVVELYPFKTIPVNKNHKLRVWK